MESSAIYWATNLRHLRKRKGWSQDDLAEKLGITRSKLNAHENGKTINPTAEDLIAFSGFFKMSIDSLLKVDMSKLSELKLRELESGNDHYASGTKIRVLATTVDKEDREYIEYVPIKAKAGYLAGHSDPEFIASLPRFTLPHLPPSRSYRMFPTTGRSMLPIPEDCLVITEYVQDWFSIKDGTLCVLVLKSEGADFVFKVVENHIRKDRKLLLRSLNYEEFTPYEVPISEVLEVWRFVSYLSEVVPAGNITMIQIADSLREIRVEVGKLGKA
ncbi:MAG: helix-turn-helix transcriptional regulator [Bacteroidetes bacterium]|nr:helix-turn-helix transcriptional regulator [Bacteroidota bacterium]